MKNLALFLLLLFAFPLSACDFDDWGKRDKNVQKSLPEGEFPASQGNPSKTLDVEVYIDASTSMKGYVPSAVTTDYFEILRVMENAIKTGWDAPNVEFFKFGSYIEKLEGRDFLKAAYPEFYGGKIGLETKIEMVINQKIYEREFLLTVIMTDLYQKDADASLLVGLLKDNCLERGLTVGVAGIRSFFSGKIYDVGLEGQSFSFQSQADNKETYRPFYLITIGKHPDVQQFFDNLSKYTNAFDEENVVLFSQHLADPLITFVNGQRGKETRNVNEVSGITKEDLRVKQFRILDDDKNIKVAYTIPYVRARYTPLVNATSFDVDVSAYEFKERNKTAQLDTTGKLTAQASLKKGVLSLILEVAPKLFNENAKQKVHISIQPKETTYVLPLFVDSWDMGFPVHVPLDNANQLMALGPKTQNLKFFMESLLMSNYRVNKPRLFESYIYFKH